MQKHAIPSICCPILRMSLAYQPVYWQLDSLTSWVLFSKYLFSTWCAGQLLRKLGLVLKEVMKLGNYDPGSPHIPSICFEIWCIRSVRNFLPVSFLLIVKMKDDLTIQKDAPKTGCSGLTGVITSLAIRRYHQREINFELPLIDSKESTWTSAKLACERY